jgi:hypothetical protein
MREDCLKQLKENPETIENIQKKREGGQMGTWTGQ